RFLPGFGCFPPQAMPVPELADGEDDMIALGAKVAGNEGRSRGTDAIADRDVIDVEHLKRMTLDDGRLEQEVLQIFVRQSAMMLGRISTGQPSMLTTAA